jgi:hypothetical protein
MVVGAHARLLEGLYHDVQAVYGSVEAYAERACGISPATVEALRSRLLETK